MQTVCQAMEEFISGLEISRCPKGQHCGTCVTCNAKRQRDSLRGHLEKALSVAEFFLSGSFKRRTALRPLHDIDLFVVLDATAESGLLESEPKVTLARVREVIGEAYPTKDKPKAQSRSVNVDFKGTGLAFDVVPAFVHKDGGYQIPDREAGVWIRTNPREHVEHSVAANERAGGKAKPIVKALKRWNCQQAERVARSFHLELMVYDQLQSDPGSYADGIAKALRGLSSRVLYAMPEPAGVGPDVDQGLTTEERQRASKRFAEAADLADKALQAATQGRTGEAHHYWRTLLGSDYPEKGTPPETQGAPAIVVTGSVGAPDAHTKRFG
jgi:predicted nucleotidyltransferase